VFEGDGKIGEYVGGYSDWARKGGKLFSFEDGEKASGGSTSKQLEEKPEPKKAVSKKLSYKNQRELEELPAKIEALEVSQSELEKYMSQPEFYENQDDGGKSVEETLKQVADVQSQLEKTYERWEELEKLRNA
jgi:ATP-binding cassette subfamily F protein uup